MWSYRRNKINYWNYNTPQNGSKKKRDRDENRRKTCVGNCLCIESAMRLNHLWVIKSNSVVFHLYLGKSNLIDKKTIGTRENRQFYYHAENNDKTVCMCVRYLGLHLQHLTLNCGFNLNIQWYSLSWVRFFLCVCASFRSHYTHLFPSRSSQTAIAFHALLIQWSLRIVPWLYRYMVDWFVLFALNFDRIDCIWDACVFLCHTEFPGFPLAISQM